MIRTSEQIKAEIERKFGFFPPFFDPALESPQVLENLWQQTLTAYVNNPLPSLFKEKLNAYLSRFCAVPYCMVCHSCVLRPLGMTAGEVLKLLSSPPPGSADIQKHLSVLAAYPDLTAIQPEANSALEESLLACAVYLFLEGTQAQSCRTHLRRLLGNENYHHLVAYMAYIKTCHTWMEAHPEISYEADQRTQEHLGRLLEQEPDLLKFFQTYRERVRRERLSWTEQLAELAQHQRREEKLQQQIHRERLVTQIAQRIRKSLNLEEILHTTVSEVRQFLTCDRVFIYRFRPDWSGVVVIESADSRWEPIQGRILTDPHFVNYVQPYKAGRIQATADVYAGGLSQCHIDFLAELQVRSTLVVPILQGEQLWGLLVANHCSGPRQWQQLEIDLLKQLSTHVAIAIQQSELYQQAQTELKERQRAEEALRQQIEREQLVGQIAQRIRKSLNLAEILNTTVSEVRQFLQSDRVFVYRFRPDWSGVVVIESTDSRWELIQGRSLTDSTFANYIEPYKNGRIQATADIYTGGLTQCYVDFLAGFQVRATLVVPILQGEQLWGLLVANQCCEPRQWQPREIDLLRQLATQVAIAIQQSELYQRAQTELSERRRAEKSLQKAHNKLAKHTEELQQTLTELLAAEEELRQQNEELIAIRQAAESERRRYQDLFDFAPDGYLVTDAAGMIQEANCAAEALLAAPPGYLVGKPLVAFLPAAECQTFTTRLTKLQQPDWEVNLQPQSGPPFPAAITVAAVSNLQSKLGGLRWLIRDITERKRTEQKIGEQAALLDITTDAIVVRDLEQRILFWNKGAERLYGWKAEETLSRNLNQLLDREVPQLEEAQEVVLKQGEWQGELHQITKDSKQIVVQSRWTLVDKDTEKPNSILIVNTDITEKKQLEAQFLRAQRLESIGTLAGGIAHDLNNILTPMLAAPQLLQLKFPQADQQSQRLLKTLETNAKRGAELVKQVLSFARGVEGKRTILQVKHLISEIKQIAKETFPKSIEIRTEISHDLWTVRGDATQLHQVLMNLSVNARDAMPDGGTLSISAKNLLIDENYARMNLDAKVGPYIVLTVVDTGTGMPPEIVDRIFEPFFTTKELGKGTGLGLSTVIGIVKSHAGFVDVSSQVGQGTEFKIYLPAVKGVETEQTENFELPVGHGETILVVDDEVPIREVSKTALEAYGYRVLTASDGIEAVAQYTQYRETVGVVVIDMIMPSMDGPTTIRTLQKINPQVKVVAVSGLSANEQAIAAIGTNLKAFLLKPYTSRDLLRTLSKVLNGN